MASPQGLRVFPRSEGARLVTALPAANPAYVTRGAAGAPLGGQDASAGGRVNGRWRYTRRAGASRLSTNRGNGMSFPVAAICVADASAVPTGHYFFLNGNWFISVDASQGRGSQSAICLSGDATGLFAPSPAGEAIYIGGGFKVVPRVKSIEASVTGPKNPWFGSLILGVMPHIYTEQRGLPRVFSIDGFERDGEGLADSRRRFVEWEAWLVDSNGKDVQQQPLFVVASPASKD